MDSTSMRNRAYAEHAPSSLLATPACQAFPVIATEACASNGMRRITPGISCHSDRGLCIQWNEAHHTWANIPRRCKKLFKSAFAQYNDSGETLVITKKE